MDTGEHDQCSEAITPGALVIARWSGRCICMGDTVSLGIVEAFLPERGRWALRLANGRCCAALPSHLRLAPFVPYQRVQINDHACPLVIGNCGIVIGYDQMQRWVVNLDIGFTVKAREADLSCSDQPQRTRNLRQLQALALAKSVVSPGSVVFGVPLDLIQSIANALPSNPPLAVWARYIAAISLSRQ